MPFENHFLIDRLLVQYAFRILDHMHSSLCEFIIPWRRRKCNTARNYGAEHLPHNSIIGNLAGLELEGQFVSDKGDELRICRFSLGITDGIAKEALEGVQIPSVPCNLNSVSDCTLHTAGRGLECFCHLGVQYLGDGVGVPYGPPGGLAGCS